MLLLFLVTPFLINKRPGPQAAIGMEPGIVWISLNLLFVIGAAPHKFWAAICLGGGQVLLGTALALRSSRLGAITPLPSTASARNVTADEYENARSQSNQGMP